MLGWPTVQSCTTSRNPTSMDVFPSASQRKLPLMVHRPFFFGSQEPGSADSPVQACGCALQQRRHGRATTWPRCNAHGSCCRSETRCSTIHTAFMCGHVLPKQREWKRPFPLERNVLLIRPFERRIDSMVSMDVSWSKHRRATTPSPNALHEHVLEVLAVDHFVSLRGDGAKQGTLTREARIARHLPRLDRSIDRLCRLTSRKGRQDKRHLDSVRSRNLHFRGGGIAKIANVPLVGPRKLCLPSTRRRIALAKPFLEPNTSLPSLLLSTRPPHCTDKVARGVLSHPPPFHPSYAFVAPRSFTSTSTCTCREGRSSWTPPRPKLTSSS